MVVICVLNGEIRPFGRRHRTRDVKKLRRTHPVTVAVVPLTGVDHVVDREIRQPLLVSVCSRSLFWLPEFNDELCLIRLYFF